MITDTVWGFAIASKVKFGEGAIEEIGSEAKRMKGTKALIVTDKGVINAGLLDDVEKPLEKEGIKTVVFSEVLPDPPLEVAEKCLNFAQRESINIVVGFGGGSSMDIAKIVAMAMVHGGPIIDYVDPPTGVGKKIPNRGLPLIAVPTTAGTGSEVSPTAVITLMEEEIKFGFSSNYLRPDVAIVDPLLTVTAPPSITAATGMDALAHAIESYTTRRYCNKPIPKSPEDRPVYNGGTVLTDILAVKAIELIAKYLRRTVNNGYDLEARHGMSLASLLAGMAFSNSGLTATHAIGYAVASKYKMAHGITNAMLLPHVMEYNSTSEPEKFAEVAKILGENVQQFSLREAAMKSAEVVRYLSKDIGIPQNLSYFGAKKEDIPELAKKAMAVKRLMMGNPRAITEKDVEEILRKAL